MRFAAWAVAFAVALVTPALGQVQNPPGAAPAANAAPQAAPKAQKSKASKKAAAKAAKAEPSAAPPPPATTAQKDAYAAIPVAERLAIQSDLVWSGDLVGGLDPEFGDRAIAAVKAFQKRNKFDETGILTPEQRQTLGGAMRSRKEYNGWRIVEDTVTPGVRLGIPAKLVPQTEIGTTGSRWTAARGEIQIETFREKMAGSQLSELFEEMKKRPSGRRTETSSLAANSFTIAGMQGLKRFHIRAYLKDNEARGITILFDQAMEGIMLPMVDTITNSFLPFGDPNSASTSRRVEYGSGIVVTDRGHIVTERQLTDNCQGIVVAGLGRADRLAEDKTTDLALLRVNGAGALKPLAFSAEPPKSIELTLVGIAEPEAQAGARNVTTSSARLRGVNGSRVLLDTNPARGFVGGAALDGQGQLVGMIDLAATVTAGPATANGQAALVPTASIRKFLDNAGVHPATGKSDVAAARNAIVRVICVRK
jgi:S1-C subfamily serine protease